MSTVYKHFVLIRFLRLAISLESINFIMSCDNFIFKRMNFLVWTHTRTHSLKYDASVILNVYPLFKWLYHEHKSKQSKNINSTYLRIERASSITDLVQFGLMAWLKEVFYHFCIILSLKKYFARWCINGCLMLVYIYAFLIIHVL